VLCHNVEHLPLENIVTAMKSVHDPDTMYLWEARKEADYPQFLEAMQKEIDDHTKREHWKLCQHSQVPPGATVLPSVWSINANAASLKEKCKARLTVDGSKQQYGKHYDETYSTVIQWSSTRFFLIQALLDNWYTWQIDFVEKELYMEIPKGVTLEGANRKDYVLQLLRNLYGQKQAGHVWYEHLVQGLLKIGFKCSKVGDCVFYCKKGILLVYVDDSILLSPHEEELKFLINKMSKCFDIQEDGDLCDYLGIQVKRHVDGSMTLTQPQLIDSILKDMHLDKDNSTGHRLPALSSILIHKDSNGKDFTGNFHYHSIIGKLNYLEKSTRPYIAYAVHQCAHFSSQPKQSHGEAVKYICRYLKSTRDKGLIIRPQGNKFECYVDASHARDWKQESSMDGPSTARSTTGFVFSFAQCPVIWGSKLQTEIALSSTEAEYIALSSTI